MRDGFCYTPLYTPVCVNVEDTHVATNLALDDRLILEAKKLGNYRTKREAVTAALEEYILRRKQQRILALRGKIDYFADYDHKKLRRLR